MLGGYGAAKHGLAGLSSSLRAELAPFKIKVVLIEPGAIKTPIWNRGLEAGQQVRSRDPERNIRYADHIEAASAWSRRAAASGLDASTAAEVILDALQRDNPAPRQVVGRDAQVMAAMIRMLPFRALYGLIRARGSMSG
jgi:NAD(P)-dependent dehydrogenase (short-subunit alcohol dehydrogenase family)